MKAPSFVLILPLMILFNQTLLAQEKMLESFNLDSALQNWKIYKSDGVEIEISPAEGFKGKGIRLDYNFTKGTGYGGIQKIIPIELPENYLFTFYLKAESPANNFEIKFLDSTGQNVWWINNRNFDFPTEWKKVKIKKRNINFAWGPTEDKTLRKIDRIEFTIASYVGGKGTVFIDELKFEELPTEDNSPIFPLAIASSELDKNYSVKNILDKNPETSWKSNDDENQNIILDLKRRREFGGIIIDWDKENFAKDFNVYLTQNGNGWEKVYSVSGAFGNKSYIRLKEEDAVKIKIELFKSSRGVGYGINEISVENVDYSADINNFFINIAKDYPRGYFPRYFNEEGTFWSIVGVNNDTKEALINEDGMVEVDKKSFSIEPFLSIDGKFITWNDVKKEQTLEENYLPIPYVKWNYKDLLLETKAFVWGNANKYSVLYLRYNITNNSPEKEKGNLFLAIRPFQVNPYYQWLNITGGVSEIYSLNYNKEKVFVNDDKVVIPITKDNDFVAATYDEGDITTFLKENKIPQSKSVVDERGFASGCLSYSFDLDKDETKTIYLAVPFYGYETGYFVESFGQGLAEEIVEKNKSDAKNFWENKVNHIKFNLPKSADKIINTWKSNLAYILINRDNAGIQPGSRSYERSWIRDGALTSAALLRCGLKEEVREFIEWYAPYQFENGKVPCVVDSRGPDSVPENDSHGELIYLIKQYFNFTKDTTFLSSQNKYVLNAVNYIQSLINERSTDHYKNGNDSVRAYYGILPESISHEGYSAKPMHSYWDDFFALRGLKDAAEIQQILGNKDEYKRVSIISDQFKTNLFNSLDLAIKVRGIDYIPGCVELGDFDATSTTIALYPTNELHNLPQPYLNNTFNKYYDHFVKRKNNEISWTAYTPYENRLIGTFILLDQPERAHELIEFFLDDQRPQGWNHWAEVVWNDERHPGFIGDMPHTWVGSDFINSVRMMFVYENEFDTSLVVGAGLYQDWVESPNGMSVENLPTYYGDLSYSIKKEDNVYLFYIYGDLGIPVNGIKIKNFNRSKLPAKVTVNKKEKTTFTKNEIAVREFPAEIEVDYGK